MSYKLCWRSGLLVGPQAQRTLGGRHTAVPKSGKQTPDLRVSQLFRPGPLTGDESSPALKLWGTEERSRGWARPFVYPLSIDPPPPPKPLCSNQASPTRTNNNNTCPLRTSLLRFC